MSVPLSEALISVDFVAVAVRDKDADELVVCDTEPDSEAEKDAVDEAERLGVSVVEIV